LAALLSGPEAAGAAAAAVEAGIDATVDPTAEGTLNGVMPPMGANINLKAAGEIAQYVRALSGLAHDQIRVIPGKREYLNNCVACHGVEGKGNKALGAPNLTDDIWLYGSSEAAIVQSILNGRNNRMPAQEHLLTPEQVRMLTAWVWGLSGGQDVTTSAAMSKGAAN
jgi:cytochrome c oxidase cbb3-type subunit 3